MALRFIKLPGHKQFNYTPRYYNEQKEKMDERVKKAKKELGIEDSEEKHVPLVKGQMRSYFERNVREKKQSSFRLIIILIILFALVYWLLTSIAEKL